MKCQYLQDFHLIFHSVESGSYGQGLNGTFLTNHTLVVGSRLAKGLIQAPLKLLFSQN